MKKEISILTLTLLSLFLVLSLSFSSALDENLTNITDTNQTTLTNITTIQNTTILPPLVLKSINPSSFNVGDVQFNIPIYNQGNETLKNLVPLLSGNGFSTSNIIPIDELSPGSTGYFLVLGHFNNPGNIELSIKVNSQTFYSNITINPVAAATSSASSIASQELLQNLTLQLSDLKKIYNLLDQEQAEKASTYDVSKINLADAKKYLRDTEAAILTQDTTKAQANLALALEEIKYQQDKMSKLTPISTVDKLKSNAGTFSAIAGALVTFFAVYELLKKKSTAVVSKVQEKIKK